MSIFLILVVVALSIFLCYEIAILIKEVIKKHKDKKKNNNNDTENKIDN